MVRYIPTFILLVAMTIFNFSIASGQESSLWSQARRIPGYEVDSWPPILVVDKNNAVHAFSYQWLDDSGGTRVRAIHYNKWDSNQGWTVPIDILLSPLKSDARLLDVSLDDIGNFHLIFWGGDNTEANIYYSSAPIKEAGNAGAWSNPVLIAQNVQDPENGVFYSLDENTFVTVFSGKSQGNGLYISTSDNRGLTWTDPSLVYNVSDLENFVNELSIYEGETGHFHMVWNEVNKGGQGRGIYYSMTGIDQLKWSTPIKIAEAESGYGTNTPAIFEYQDRVMAFYNLDGKIWQRVSQDGINWSIPARLFSRHVGVNGSISLVIDHSDTLHILFGQRITGAPDIHGMWHSSYDGFGWSEPEPIVSGPAITDMEGEKGFDPFEARAVISQDNFLLVTWRTDPGMHGNGVWYSYTNLGMMYPSTSTSKTEVSEVETTIATASSTIDSQPVREVVPISAGDYDDTSPTSSSNPISTILIGVVPVVILLVFICITLFWVKRL